MELADELEECQSENERLKKERLSLKQNLMNKSD